MDGMQLSCIFVTFSQRDGLLWEPRVKGGEEFSILAALIVQALCGKIKRTNHIAFLLAESRNNYRDLVCLEMNGQQP